MKNKQLLFNKYFYAITGRMDVFYTALRQYFLWTILIVSVIINQIFLLKDFLNFFFHINLEKLVPARIIWIFIIIVLVSIYIAYRQYKNLIAQITIENLDKTEKDALKESIVLSPSYLQSGYEVQTYDNGDYGLEYYVMSSKINRALQDGKGSLKVVKNPAYKLPKAIVDLMPKIMQINLSGNRFMNNGRLLKQNQSLFLQTLDAQLPIGVSKVGYYDGQCSHEICFKKFYHSEEVGTYFDGKSLLVNDDNVFYSLAASKNANFLGASTLVFTSDGYILIARQGLNSKANRNRYVPSGSGSVEWKKDYQKTGYQQLDQILISAMEREFCEEWGLPTSYRKSMKTCLIGYARLVERGGKPDYFGISYLDKTFAELKNGKGNITLKEAGLQQESDIELQFSNISDISPILEQFCNEKASDNLLSVQVYLFKEIIKEMAQDGQLKRVLIDLGMSDR